MANPRCPSPLADLPELLEWLGIPRPQFEKDGRIDPRTLDKWISGESAPSAQAWEEKIARGAGFPGDLRGFELAQARFRVASAEQNRRLAAQLGADVRQEPGSYDERALRPTLWHALAPILNIEIESMVSKKWSSRLSELRQRMLNMLAALEADTREFISIYHNYSSENGIGEAKPRGPRATAKKERISG